MKRLQTATWDLTLSSTAAMLIGSYTADADRAIYVNCTARDVAVGGDNFRTFLSVTRPTYAETIIDVSNQFGSYGFSELIGSPALYQFSSSGTNYALIKTAVPILVHAGDVVKFYLTEDSSLECEGYLEFYGTETPAEIAAAVATNSTIQAILAKVNLITSSTVVSITAPVSGSSITILRGDTLSASITGLGTFANYSTLYLTAKAHPEDTDAEALIQVKKNLTGVSDGLMILNGATAADPTHGSITIDDPSAGDITLALDADECASLPLGDYAWDMEIIRSAGTPVSTLAIGPLSVVPDYTLTTS